MANIVEKKIGNGLETPSDPGHSFNAEFLRKDLVLEGKNESSAKSGLEKTAAGSGKNAEGVVAQTSVSEDGKVVQNEILNPGEPEVARHKRVLEALVNGGDPHALMEELLGKTKN